MERLCGFVIFAHRGPRNQSLAGGIFLDKGASAPNVDITTGQNQDAHVTVANVWKPLHEFLEI